MTEEILTKSGLKHLEWFESLLRDAGIPDPNSICDIAARTIRLYSDRNQDSPRSPMPLEVRWYHSLRESGIADYSVYADNQYLGELWACWSIYSRNYLVEARKIRSLAPTGVLDAVRGHGAVVDLGNGIGMSTAALKQLFPESTVYGTNLRETSQWTVSKVMQDRFGFQMVENLNEIQSPVGLVFASEYFEHFDEPIAHLEQVVESLSPNSFLIASAFGADAIGHFDLYRHKGICLGKKGVGKAFNKRLVELGYMKVATSLWNNRPSLWIKREDRLDLKSLLYEKSI
jgi:SAM-dependent methyltransferase